jgi:hypothetical protein
MYSACIFCHANLGANEAIEHFPIGRRLAFDAARGRLWVVCRKCERWNLSPLEERWEAIEECERLFTTTRLRVSTDNIGLARISEGLELVRIGLPLRPEMAAWRYGDQFGRRRTRRFVYAGVGAAAAGGLLILGPVTGIIAGSSWGLWNVATTANSAYQQRRVRAMLDLPGHDDPVRIRLKQLNRTSLVRENDDWALRVPFEAKRADPGPLSLGRARRWLRYDPGGEDSVLLTGESALRAASKLLPAVNASGANKAEVASAVRMIGEASDPTELFAKLSSRKLIPKVWPATRTGVPGTLLTALPKEARLALEMATHEDAERRALEGELAVLETEWQQAEEIASISDDMFLPENTDARLAELKARDEK